jgi:hypothetical protein
LATSPRQRARSCAATYHADAVLGVRIRLFPAAARPIVAGLAGAYGAEGGGAAGERLEDSLLKVLLLVVDAEAALDVARGGRAAAQPRQTAAKAVAARRRSCSRRPRSPRASLRASPRPASRAAGAPPPTRARSACASRRRSSSSTPRRRARRQARVRCARA